MLKNHIFLTLELAKRDLKARYAGSSLGIFWAFLQPLLQLGLFTFVFSTVLKISLAGERGIENFPLFLFAGLLPWMSLQEMLVRSTTVLVDQGALVKKLAFPPHILVGSILVSALLHQGVAALLFVIVLAIRGELHWTALGLPVLMVLQTLLVMGLCYFLAGLQVFFRDTAQLVSYAALVWFYGTPIVYPLSLINDPRLISVLKANPATLLVEAYRDILLRGAVPRGGGLLMVFALGSVLTYAGIRAFHRWRSSYADLL
jgi:ABC-type polysaccharide/polyol phosphate export permease